MKLTVVIAIAGLLATASARAQASDAASKSEATESRSKQAVLPPEQNIAEAVGRGDPLVLHLRVSGPREETWITFLVDTGWHVTTLDKSFEGMLGSRRGKQRLVRAFSGRGVEQAHVYTAPRLYLGNVQLLTGPTVLTSDLATPSGNIGPVDAVLGMDCLTNYCVQMDFAARKLRFLESHNLKRESLGRAFSMDCTHGVPVVAMNLLGDRNLRFILDSGFYQGADGTLPGEVIRSALQNHTAKEMGGGCVTFKTVDVGAESYKGLSFREVKSDERAGVAGYIGLSFLARHVVTFDFPRGVFYLRSVSAQAER